MAGFLVVLSTTGFIAGGLTVPESLSLRGPLPGQLTALAHREGFQPVDLTTHDGLSLAQTGTASPSGQAGHRLFLEPHGRTFAAKPSHLFTLARKKTPRGYGLLACQLSRAMAAIRDDGARPNSTRMRARCWPWPTDSRLAPNGYSHLRLIRWVPASRSYAAAAFRPLGGGSSRRRSTVSPTSWALPRHLPCRSGGSAASSTRARA